MKRVDVYRRYFATRRICSSYILQFSLYRWLTAASCVRGTQERPGIQYVPLTIHRCTSFPSPAPLSPHNKRRNRERQRPPRCRSTTAAIGRGRGRWWNPRKGGIRPRCVSFRPAIGVSSRRRECEVWRRPPVCSYIPSGFVAAFWSGEASDSPEKHRLPFRA